MVCIYCGGETAVINSRHQKRHNSVWRRRRCILCDTVFSTSEAADYQLSILVQSRTNKKSLQPFSRDKLLLSLHKSLAHREHAIDDAAGLCATIIAKALPSQAHGVVSNQRIIEATLVALQRFDQLAARHYQAYHQA